MDSPSDLLTKVLDEKSTTRRSAAKKLQKEPVVDSSGIILEALKRELENENSWENQYHMILALTACDDQKAIPLLTSLTERDLRHRILYIGIGYAVANLIRFDEEKMLGLFKDDNNELIEGVICGIAIKRHIPSKTFQSSAINHEKKLPEFGERGNWGRTWIAIASAGWDKTITSEFLQRAKTAQFRQLRDAANASLNGEYLKLNPF